MKNVKKLFISLLLFGALGISGCSNSPVVTPEDELVKNGRYVTEVTLDYEYVSLQVGESIKLNPTVKFLNDEVKEISAQWKNSKANVASLEDGLVFALKPGTTYVTYIAGFKSASCTIFVPSQGGGDDGDEPTPTPPEPPAPGEFTITLSATTKTLNIGGTFKLTATTSEAAEVSWSSSDASVATVEAGLVTAVAVGTATITAAANEKSATCVVTVEEAAPVTPVDPEKNVTVYFFLDYNNVDIEAEVGDKLLAKFKWYQDVPLASAPIPANPTKAADPAFPYFVGWSSHTIIDTKNDLWDMEKDVIGTRSFIYIYGIWSDVEAFNV